MIETGVLRLRDPFVVAGEDCYYLYGTDVSESGWEKTSWACYRSTGKSLSGKWEKLKTPVYIRPENAEKNLWAPEVHKYNGYYYMFASYFSSATGHRGCSILKSDSLEGPFVEITDGHITPKEWDSIDGTFWVDGEGQPWMVFVHEWTSTDDGIGRMAAAKLSEDLTHFTSEPKELFRADVAPHPRPRSGAASPTPANATTDPTFPASPGRIWGFSSTARRAKAISRTSSGRTRPGKTTISTTLSYASMAGSS